MEWAIGFLFNFKKKRTKNTKIKPSDCKILAVTKWGKTQLTDLWVKLLTLA